MEALIIVFGLQPLVRDYPALKEKLKMSLEGSVRGRSDSSEYVILGTKLVQIPHPPIFFAMRDLLCVRKI